MKESRVVSRRMLIVDDAVDPDTCLVINDEWEECDDVGSILFMGVVENGTHNVMALTPVKVLELVKILQDKIKQHELGKVERLS